MATTDEGWGENRRDSLDDYEKIAPQAPITSGRAYSKTVIGGAVMGSFIKLVATVGILWFLVLVGVSVGASYFPDSKALPMVAEIISQYGGQVGHFIAPVLQLALIIMILLSAAERLGLLSGERSWPSLSLLGTGNNIQAFIAVAIVGALVIGALADVGNIGVLKDLSLVVVGFYFGTRRRQNDIDEAIVAATFSGTAESGGLKQPSATAADDRRESANPAG